MRASMQGSAWLRLCRTLLFAVPYAHARNGQSCPSPGHAECTNTVRGDQDRPQLSIVPGHEFSLNWTNQDGFCTYGHTAVTGDCRRSCDGSTWSYSCVCISQEKARELQGEVAGFWGLVAGAFFFFQCVYFFCVAFFYCFGGHQGLQETIVEEREVLRMGSTKEVHQAYRKYCCWAVCCICFCSLVLLPGIVGIVLVSISSNWNRDDYYNDCTMGPQYY